MIHLGTGLFGVIWVVTSLLGVTVGGKIELSVTNDTFLISFGILVHQYIKLYHDIRSDC